MLQYQYKAGEILENLELKELEHWELEEPHVKELYGIRLKKDPTIDDWLGNLNPVRNTERAYTQGMLDYIKFTGMTPSELKLEAKNEIKAGIDGSERKIKRHFIGYKKSMIAAGLSDHTIKLRMSGIRSFYDSFEIDLPKIKSDRRKARTLEENDSIPTKEDLQASLKVCTPLEKAIMLVGISSGLASNEIRHLRIRDFKNGIDEKTGVTVLDFRGKKRIKTGVKFITCLTPEATQAVKDYLEFRNRESKAATEARKKQLKKQKIVNDDGYLFICRQIDNAYLETHDEGLRQMTENVVQKLYRSISDKVKMNSKKGVYNVIRSHTMRKYFDTVLHEAGVDDFFIQYLEGHDLGDTKTGYFKPSIESVRQRYTSIMHNLAMEKEFDPNTNTEFQNMLEDNEKLQKIAANATVERDELRELKEEIEQLKQSLTEKDNLESHYRRIANESIIRARGDMLPKSKEFAEHEERMSKDPMYSAGYTKFIYIYGSELNLRNIEDSRAEHIKKLFDTENEIKTNTIKTLDKLLG